jgi:hypothetical protein
MLGSYLQDLGLGDCNYISGLVPIGHEGNAENHGWLELGGVTVDITADQYRSLGMSRVIVTRNSVWHDALARFGSPQPASLAHYRNSHQELLRRDYQTLVDRASSLSKG